MARTRVMEVEMVQNWTFSRGTSKDKKTWGRTEMEREQARNCSRFPSCTTQWSVVPGRVSFGYYGFVPLRYQSENISQTDIEIYSSELGARNRNLGDRYTCRMAIERKSPKDCTIRNFKI